MTTIVGATASGGLAEATNIFNTDVGTFIKFGLGATLLWVAIVAIKKFI